MVDKKETIETLIDSYWLTCEHHDKSWCLLKKSIEVTP